MDFDDWREWEDLYCVYCEREGHTIRGCPDRDDEFLVDVDYD